MLNRAQSLGHEIVAVDCSTDDQPTILINRVEKLILACGLLTGFLLNEHIC